MPENKGVSDSEVFHCAAVVTNLASPQDKLRPRSKMAEAAIEPRSEAVAASAAMDSASSLRGDGKLAGSQGRSKERE